MPNAVMLKDGRKALAEMLALVNGGSTPGTIGRLLTCQIGNGAAVEFTDPLDPPPVNTENNNLRGALLTGGANSTPTVQYLVAAPGTGAILYDGDDYDVSVDPTDLLLFTWLYTTSQANGEWREVLWKMALSGRGFMKLHPVGTVSGWQTKTSAEERPVRLLIEL